MRRGTLLILIGVLWGGQSSIAAGDTQDVVVEVKVYGTRRIEPTTVLSKMTLRPGTVVTPDQVSKNIKTIFALGYFDDVRMEVEDLPEGIRLLVLVEEKPFVMDVFLSGNEHITEERLREDTVLHTGIFLDYAQMGQEARRIKALYEEEGFATARIIPVIKKVGAGEANVTYVIHEGDKTLVRTITFQGNEAFTSRRLKKAIETATYFWLTSWLTGAGTHKKEEVEADVDRLREFYHNHGYLQVQVGRPRVELSPDRKWYTLTFPIVEGASFRIQSVSFRGNTVLSSFQLRQGLKTKEGNTYSRATLRQDVSWITEQYGEQGYAFASVSPAFRPDHEAGTLDLVLEIREGVPVKVRKIMITGNDKTRDKVIRRELLVKETEVLNTKALRRSFQRLNNLNFFETIELVPEQVDQETVDLAVRVKEKSTGMLSMGAGFSSIEGPVGIFNIAQGNLFGRGQLLKASGNLGGRRTTYSLTFREPYLFDRPVSGTASAFNQVRNFFTYNERRRGFGLILGRSFTEYVKGSLSYGLEDVEIFNVLATAPALIQDQEQEGKRTTSMLGTSLTRDTRDFFLDPSEGSRHTVSARYAGTFLGGTTAFYRIKEDSVAFFPAWRTTVLSLRGRIGFVRAIDGTLLPIGERFFVGGINTVRGFFFGRAGPVESGTILGGDKQLIINVEYLIPLVPEARIKWLFFADAGRAFRENEGLDFAALRYSAGGGLRWISPVGPLRLEWGANLFPQQGEPPSTLEFTIGTLF